MQFYNFITELYSDQFSHFLFQYSRTINPLGKIRQDNGIKISVDAHSHRKMRSSACIVRHCPLSPQNVGTCVGLNQNHDS